MINCMDYVLVLFAKLIYLAILDQRVLCNANKIKPKKNLEENIKINKSLLHLKLYFSFLFIEARFTAIFNYKCLL